LRGKVTGGGSTITQQTAKLGLSMDRTMARKARELLVARELEDTFTKNEILEIYFNGVSFGHGTKGVQNGAQLYFGKNVEDLSLGQSAMMVGLLKGPANYSPFLDKMEACKGRQKYVLNRMVDEGFINAREAEAAYAEDLQLIPYKKKVDRDAENRLPPEIRAPVMKQLDASLQAR